MLTTGTSTLMNLVYWIMTCPLPPAIDTYEPNAYCLGSRPVLISLLLNHPPMANDDFYQTYDNTQLSVNSLDGVLANDVELNKYDKVTASLVTPPANGTLVLNADGSFVYTPNANFAGQDTFTYSMDTDFFFRTQSTMTDTHRHDRSDLHREIR